MLKSKYVEKSFKQTLDKFMRLEFEETKLGPVRKPFKRKLDPNLKLEQPDA